MPIPPTFPFPHGRKTESFDFYGSVSVAAGATVILQDSDGRPTFTVPNRVKSAWITLFGHGIDNVALWATAVWVIQRNTVPVPFYANIRDQLSEFQDPHEIGPIKLAPNDQVTIQVTNGGGVAGLFAARFRGFYDYEIG